MQHRLGEGGSGLLAQVGGVAFITSFQLKGVQLLHKRSLGRRQYQVGVGQQPGNVVREGRRVARVVLHPQRLGQLLDGEVRPEQARHVGARREHGADLLPVLVGGVHPVGNVVGFRHRAKVLEKRWGQQ